MKGGIPDPQQVMTLLRFRICNFLNKQDELHKINISHILRLLTAANKRVSAYIRSDQDFIKKNVTYGGKR